MTVELAARELGSGEPLLLLHGLFGSSRNWVSIQKQLANTHQVISLDLRNHGDSGRHAQMNYSLMADDVQAFLDGRGLRQVALLGHSMGGKVAMTLALRNPAQVGPLIVVDIAPVRYPPHHTEIVAGLRALDLSALDGRKDADDRLRASVPDPQVRGFLLQNLVQKEGRWSWRINLAAIDNCLDALGDFPFAPGEAVYPHPSLFICGGDSDYVTAERHPVITCAFPSAQIVELPGVGHWPHAQVPEAFINQVRRFMGLPH